MAIHIVTEYAGHHALRHGMRRVVWLLGAVLIVLGLGAAAVPVLLGVLVALNALFGDEPVEPLDDEGTTQLVVLCIVALAGLVVGLRLVRGRRRIAVFLRRFRFADATATVTYALGTAVGRGWRLITLDDAAVAPVGVTPRQHRFSRLGVWIPLLVIAGGALWIFGGPGADFADRLIDDFTSSQGDGDFGAAIGAALAAVFVIALLLVFAFIAMAFFGLVTVFSLGSRRAIAKAEGEKAQAITKRRHIGRRIPRIAARARRILGPRLVVVRVVTDLWKDVVERLLRVASVVIIDVSEVSDNLLWEVEAIERRRKLPWIAIARQDRIDARPAPGSPAQRLVPHLAGRPVLAYDTSETGMRRFSRSLRSMLEDVA